MRDVTGTDCCLSAAGGELYGISTGAAAAAAGRDRRLGTD